LFHSHWIHTMLRCVTLAGLLVASCLVLPAAAQQQRAFPATALRGELRIQQPPEASLNGRPARLAPGARIRGADNLLQMSGALAGQALTVHYTLDDYGLLRDVWVLTPAERARQPWPATPAEAAAWRFDPVGQTWSR
jgi:hypothetical protein